MIYKYMIMIMLMHDNEDYYFDNRDVNYDDNII